jgi:uncharacterized protein YcbX
MRVSEIWRHPVKSLQGESLAVATLESDGLQGDRCWGIRDDATGRILTGRREPDLLLAAASLADDGRPVITLPSGAVHLGTGADVDAALSDWLRRPVTLVASVGAPGAPAEFFADATDDSSDALEWTMPAGRFVDALPILLLTTASMRAGAALHPAGDWGVRRFRPNVLVEVDGDEWAEDSWCGHSVQLGAVELKPLAGCARCTMVTRPQPGIERDLDMYRTLARHHGGTMGVWSTVQTPGNLRVGDDVTVTKLDV